MAWERPGIQTSEIAGADLSASQYRFVKENAAGKIVATHTAGAAVMGVLQNNPANTRAATVMRTGATKVVAGAAVAIDALVTTDTAGRAVTATTGQTIAGVARIAAAGAGEIITIELERRGAAA